MTSTQEPYNDVDIALLSAYLDNQTTLEERTLLEARLEREPALRNALDELRLTTRLLRELPRMTPPRSFTMDPATVQQPRWGAVFNWLRIGSALAGVLLALTLTLDFVGGGPASFGAAPVSESTAGNTPGAPPEAADAATLRANEGTAGTQGFAAAATSAPTAGAAAAAEPTATAAEASAAESGEAALKATTPTESLAPEAAPAAPAEDETQDTTASGPALTLQAAPAPTTAASRTFALPTTAAGAITTSDSSSPDTAELAPQATTQSRPQATAQGIRPLRLVQFGLGVLTMLLALAAVWVRRTNMR